MKNVIFILVLLTFTVAFSNQSFAEDGPEKTKFKRGLVNTFTGIFEIPKQIKNEVKGAEKVPEKVVSFLGGTVKGVTYAIGRTGSGLWDVFTFHLERPANYEPLMKPDYVCEKLAEELHLQSTSSE